MKKYYEIFPNGCTSHQRDMLRNGWFGKYGNPFMDGVTWSNEIKQLDELDSCLDMLNSLYAYNPFWKDEFYQKGSAERLSDDLTDSYYDYFLTQYKKVGGKKEDFDKMLNIQIEHLKRSSVLKNIHTDNEGVSYNSIKEIEEVAYF